MQAIVRILTTIGVYARRCAIWAWPRIRNITGRVLRLANTSWLHRFLAFAIVIILMLMFSPTRDFASSVVMFIEGILAIIGIFSVGYRLITHRWPPFGRLRRSRRSNSNT
jgi:hypothetical protein